VALTGSVLQKEKRKKKKLRMKEGKRTSPAYKPEFHPITHDRGECKKKERGNPLKKRTGKRGKTRAMHRKNPCPLPGSGELKKKEKVKHIVRYVDKPPGNNPNK